jgi:hypothetical protein
MVFPDRARWTMRRDGTDDRRIEYRFGEHAFALELRERESEPLADGDLAAFQRRVALRQAAFVWPDGAAWEGTGEEREAPIAALSGDPPAASPAPSPVPSIGRLVAHLDASGRPRSIESRDPSGRLEETLEIQAWSSGGGRDWPARLRLLAEGEPIWEETVIDVGASTRVDDYFVPVNQRQVLRPYAALERPRLPRAAVLRLPLAAGADWAAARARADEARRERRAELLRAAVALDERTWIGLSPDTLAPLFVELRLLEPSARLPAGFEERPERDALRLTLGGEAPPGAAERDRLRAALPPGRTAEAWTAAVGNGEVLLDCVLAP